MADIMTSKSLEAAASGCHFDTAFDSDSPAKAETPINAAGSFI